MKKLLGKVTNEEKEQVMAISRRRNALHELFSSLNSEAATPNNTLYERIVEDIGDTNQRLKDWWITTAKAHNWSFTEKDAWQVEYDSNELYLITEDT